MPGILLSITDSHNVFVYRAGDSCFVVLSVDTQPTTECVLSRQKRDSNCKHCLVTVYSWHTKVDFVCVCVCVCVFIVVGKCYSWKVERKRYLSKQPSV